jgi:FkbM family methyltransferase
MIVMKIRKRIDNFIENTATLGIRNAVSLVWNSSFLKRKTCRIWLPHCAKPIQIRTQTSDFILLKQLLPTLKNWRPKTENVEVIIDAGANIGVFSIMMAKQYPQAKVIAIEPDAENLALLSENCQFYPNIEILPTALWFKREPLVIANPNAEHWARQVVNVVEATATTIDAVTVANIFNDMAFKALMFLKWI